MTVRAIIWCAVSTKGQATDDKDSLPTQEADTRAICDQNGWQIIDVLRVPGHSRRYFDIHECARDMRAEGIDAFDKLLRHWDAQDFDILVVRDGDRFARTQALLAYIVERTISIGARIYSLADGDINERNFRFTIAMGGYRAAGEIDSLMKKRQIGFDARARRGLPVNSKVVESHRLVRDEKSGKASHIALDETRLQEWENLATLILEGIAWKRMEQEMFDRFGYGSPLNQPYQPHHYYRIVYTPGFWGHNHRNFKQKGRGPWAREEGHPIPDGVLVVYNVFEPVYKGALAEKVKAELVRREAIKGNASPQTTLRFTGLFLCAECGYFLAYARTPGYVALRCNSRYEKSSTRPDCDARRYLSEKRAQAYIDQRLREMLATGNPATFLPVSQDELANDQQQIENMQRQISDLEKQIQRMILKQTSMDESLYEQYDQAIISAGNRLKKLKAHFKELQRHYAGLDNSANQRLAFDEIASLSVDGFWKQEERAINQLLLRLMGKKRFVVRDGEIIGIADAPVRKKRY